MGYELNINTDYGLRNALVRSGDATTRRSDLVFASDSNPELTITLYNSQGGLDARSGQAGYSLDVAVGPLNELVTGGTFVISGDGATLTGDSSAISYAATAAEVKTAIEELGGVATDDVEVTKIANGVFRVEFVNGLAATSIPLLVLDLDGLAPSAQGEVTQVQDGGTGVNEVQLITISQNVLARQVSWTNDASAGTWTARMQMNTGPMKEYLAGQKSAQAYIQVQLTDGSGNVETVLNQICDLSATVLGSGAQTPPVSSSYYSAAETRLKQVMNGNGMGLTGLTGGGAANLDGLTTAGVSPTAQENAMLQIYVGGYLRTYLLEQSTDAESSPAVIRPDDYADLSTKLVWRLVG